MFTDTEPLSALYNDGTYPIFAPALTLAIAPWEAPVPERASLALLGSALFGFGLMRRKKRLA